MRAAYPLICPLRPLKVSCMRTSALICLALALSACGVVPDTREPQSPAQTQSRIPSQQSPSAQTARDGRMCLATLGATGAQFEPLPDRYIAPGCHQLGTVQLARLSGDRERIEVSNLGPLACPVANTLAGWVRYGVDRAARQYLGSPIARVETMGSYACRNVAGSSRLSGHSRAEAIDVSAFILEDGRRISVKSDWRGGSEAERRFLKVVHESACKRFGTVLGPDYNAAHEDHFHVEGHGPEFCR